jgi:ureidoglycolate lyase
MGPSAMSREILIAPLTGEAFAPFGEVLEATGDPDRIINQGLCGRFTTAPRSISWRGAGDQPLQIRGAEPALRLEMVERHPLGSQAFLPMSLGPVPRDRRPGRGRRPGTPLAFRTAPGQGINLTAAPGTACSRRCAARAFSR